jgi:hypothetical protein
VPASALAASSSPLTDVLLMVGVPLYVALTPRTRPATDNRAYRGGSPQTRFAADLERTRALG